MAPSLPLKRPSPLHAAHRVPIETDKTGAAGVALIHYLASAAGFVFRDMSGIDLGIDAAVEVFTNSSTRGYVLFQIKCTKIQEDVDARDSIPVKKAPTLLAYWRALRNPVVVIRPVLDSDMPDKDGRFIARSLYAVDTSEKSLVADPGKISWDPVESRGRHTELRLPDALEPDAIGRFRRFLLATKAREKTAHVSNLLWLSNRALDAADFDEASMIINEHVERDLPWAIVQQHKIRRRQDLHNPSETELKLGEYTKHLRSPASRSALQEMGYGYLTAAMRTWHPGRVPRAQRRIELAFCAKSVQLLSRWQGAIPSASNWDGYNFLLYARIVEHVISRSADNSTIDEAASELIDRVGPDTDVIPLRANMTLWRYALVAQKQSEAEHWMNKAWKALAAARPLPEKWKDQSAHMFADAMLLRSWTLAATQVDQARQLYEAARTALEGVLRYPEIHFWMRVAVEQYPRLVRTS